MREREEESDEERKRRIRWMNTEIWRRAWMSNSDDPPEYYCEDCGLKDCVCDDSISENEQGAPA